MAIRPVDPYQSLVAANERDRAEIRGINIQNTMQMVQAAFLMGGHCQSLKDHAAVLSVERKRLTNEITLLKSSYDAEWQAFSDNLHAKIEPIHSKANAIMMCFDAMKINNFTECNKLANERSQAGQFVEEGKIWGRMAYARKHSDDFFQIKYNLKRIDEFSISLASKMKNLTLPPLDLLEKVEEQQIVPVSSPDDFFAMVVKQKESLEHQNTQASIHNESLVRQMTFLKNTHAALTKDKAEVSQKLNELILKVKKYRENFNNLYREEVADFERRYPWDRNSSLAGMNIQSYEMAKEAMERADEIINKLEQILKE